jgi:hypothetical protein
VSGSRTADGRGAGAPVVGVPEGLTREELTLAFRVIEALRGLRFGSVNLQVHDGVVVQLDVAERVRIRRRDPAKPAPVPPPLERT